MYLFQLQNQTSLFAHGFIHLSVTDCPKVFEGFANAQTERQTERQTQRRPCTDALLSQKLLVPCSFGKFADVIYLGIS